MLVGVVSLYGFVGRTGQNVSVSGWVWSEYKHQWVGVVRMYALVGGCGQNVSVSGWVWSECLCVLGVVEVPVLLGWRGQNISGSEWQCKVFIFIYSRRESVLEGFRENQQTSHASVKEMRFKVRLTGVSDRAVFIKAWFCITVYHTHTRTHFFHAY